MILDYSASMQPRMPCQIPRRASYALAVTVLCAAATGCLTVDGTLDADDTGTLAISFTAPPEASEASVRSMIAAPGISVESFALGADRKVSAKVKVEDLATIGFMKVLQGVTVTRTAEGGDQVLSITGTNLEKSIADKNVPGPKVRITLPGKVLEANEGATIDGSTVQWSFKLADWVARGKWELRARYRTPATPAPAGKGGAPKPDAKAE